MKVRNFSIFLRYVSKNFYHFLFWEATNLLLIRQQNLHRILIKKTVQTMMRRV